MQISNVSLNPTNRLTRSRITASTNWCELYLGYLKTNFTKDVNKDMWNMTFEFFLKTMQDESLSFWTENSSWPNAIDEFVVYAKTKRGDAINGMETD